MSDKKVLPGFIKDFEAAAPRSPAAHHKLVTPRHQPPPSSPLNRMQARRDGQKGWLHEHHPEVFREQKHLDAGSAERAYWHHGYMTAMSDALRLLGAEVGDPTGMILPPPPEADGPKAPEGPQAVKSEQP